MKKQFDAFKWQDKPLINKHSSMNSSDAAKEPNNTGSTYNQVVSIIEKIENSGADVVPEYGDWRNVGFAFADEFGETGRDLYHRISRYYTDYTPECTDIQYDRCLKSKGHGVTIGTFFYWCHRAGFSLNGNKHHTNTSAKSSSKAAETSDSPMRIYAFTQNPAATDSPTPQYSNTHLRTTFPSSIFTHLPPFLKKVVDVCTTDQERDLMLLGALVTMGTSLFNVSGFYDSNRIHANLYLFVSAPASSGKGRLLHCRKILLPLHKKLRAQNKEQWSLYQANLKQQTPASNNVQLPAKPPERLLFIPANTSATGMFQLLADNPEGGLIFETEGDTLTQTFKSDYGNYSDGFRKAFHHEPISFFRRMDREYVNIETPRLSAILSGTPKQVGTLIPDIENGLFSRFIFYAMDVKNDWKDVFAQPNGNSLDEYYLELGNEWLSLHQELQKKKQLIFSLSDKQKVYFNNHLSAMQQKITQENGSFILPTIRRMGIISFRVAMILTAIRYASQSRIPKNMECIDKDFSIALAITEPLLNHALNINKGISKQPQPLKNRKPIFLQNLPEVFNRSTYLSIADDLNIPRRTSDRYIQELLKEGSISRPKKDEYAKQTGG